MVEVGRMIANATRNERKQTTNTTNALMINLSPPVVIVQLPNNQGYDQQDKSH